MKRQILTLVMAAMAVLTATAQKKMVVVVDGVDKPAVDVWRVDEIKFIDEPVTLNDTPNKVDLGLSVQWADRNMGAASPEDIGRYYIGWGDITLTNESKKLEYFPVENADKDIYGGNYDVAKAKWGEDWHMPSQKEMQELIDKCHWEWDASRNGYVITREGYEGKLFLPATGYKQGYLNGEGELTEAAKGFYWTGSIKADNHEQAQLLQFDDNKDNITIAGKERYVRMAIRPVTGALVMPLAIGEITESDVTENTATVIVKLTGDLSEAKSIVVSYGTSENELSFSETIDTHHEISTDIGSEVTINLKGLTQGTTYYIKVYVVRKAEGSEPIESSIVPLTTKKNESFPVADKVDMDLPSGTKWSSWNMGASSPLDAPSDAYYVWGDSEGTVTSTSISANPYFIDTPESERSKLVNIAGTKYDIATKKWGDGWQLPTLEQFEELMRFSNSEFGEYELDGVKHTALKVTSKGNGNTIYLPCAGLIKNNEKIGGNVGYFWTAENGDVSAAVMAQPSVDVVNTSNYPYMFRLSVRPVYVGTTSDDNNNNNEEGLTSAGRAAKAVDLGVGVKWATYNVGATSPTESGYFVAFGENQEKDSYTLSNYTHYDSETQQYTKTGMNPLASEYDVANNQWGGNWRMPTFEEWANLINHCDWVWEGNGYRVYKKGSTNIDNSIFLPVTGYKVTEKTSLSHYFKNECIYRISQYNSLVGKEGDAYVFRGSQGDNLSTASFARYFGVCVRPVKP